jgi:hypothetical protein
MIFENAYCSWQDEHRYIKSCPLATNGSVKDLGFITAVDEQHLRMGANSVFVIRDNRGMQSIMINSPLAVISQDLITQSSLISSYVL